MVKSTNIQELLEKAKGDKLSSDEVDWVVKKIDEESLEEDSDSLYILIYILGLSEYKKHRKLLEKFLNYSSDPNIPKIALKSLCDYWDLTKDYLNEVKAFIRGVEWDDFDDVRLVAMSIAGEYLRKNSDPELLELLIDVFENIETNPNFRSAENPNVVQSAAYSAILRAMGKEYNEIPGVRKTLELFDHGQLDLSTIQEAKNLIGKT